MWTAIALIAIASIVAGGWRKRESKEDREAIQQLIDRMDALEQDLGGRVETLERIVTDSKEDLKRQFDHLDKAG
jgi:archaellum component FlaC